MHNTQQLFRNAMLMIRENIKKRRKEKNHAQYATQNGLARTVHIDDHILSK